MDTEISVFGGGGFIGGHYLQRHGGVYQSRNSLEPETNNILSFVSTVDNYNIWSSPTLDIHSNQVYLIRLLEASRAKFGTDFTMNFVSSWFVYGKAGNSPVPETTVCEPNGFYSITKYAAEMMLRSYCESYGIRYRIFRLANVLGVGDKKTSTKKNAVQFMIETLMRGGMVSLYRDHHVRDFIGVAECVSQLDWLTRYAPTGEIYNVGGGYGTNVNELILEVQRSYGGTVNLIDTPEFHKIVQRQNFWMDTRKVDSIIPFGGERPDIWNTIHQIGESFYA